MKVRSSVSSPQNYSPPFTFGRLQSVVFSIVFRRLQTTADDCRRLQTTADDCRRLQTTADDCRRSRTAFVVETAVRRSRCVTSRRRRPPVQYDRRRVRTPLSAPDCRGSSRWTRCCCWTGAGRWMRGSAGSRATGCRPGRACPPPGCPPSCVTCGPPPSCYVSAARRRAGWRGGRVASAAAGCPPPPRPPCQTAGRRRTRCCWVGRVAAWRRASGG